MSVEVSLGMRLLVRRRLVEAHCVRKAGFKKIVVAGGQPLEHVGQPVSLFTVHLRQCAQVAAAEQKHLKGPDGPIGD